MIKNNNKYSQMKRFHHDCRLQVYMYTSIYVDSETMTEENHYPTKKRQLRTTIKYQLQDQSQNIGLDLFTYVQNVMSQIRTLMNIEFNKKQSDNTSNNKINLFL